MVRILLTLAALVAAFISYAQTDTTQQVISGRLNSPEQAAKPYVILISADGFRSDYAQKHHATSLLSFAARGVTAKSMQPSFPSVTFPNHYSIVTGMYPSHHGLVDNSFYEPSVKASYSMSDRKKTNDKRWYGGVPIWSLAEAQKMLTANYYWVGAEAPVGLLPAYSYKFNELIPLQRRLHAVRDWLALPPEKRPHLIAFYFPEVDHEGHTYGPDAPETAKAVQLIDRSVARMNAMADSMHLAVNFIFVSDHGMTMTDTAKAIAIPKILKDTSRIRYTASSTMIHVYVKEKAGISAIAEALRRESRAYDVYLTDETPLPWHYRTSDDRYHRIGDILLTTRLPATFRVGKKPTPGKHGFDPSEPDMQATFMAWGPNIKNSGVIPAFENVNVYPLIARILGLHYEQKIDGKAEVLGNIYKK